MVRVRGIIRPTCILMEVLRKLIEIILSGINPTVIRVKVRPVGHEMVSITQVSVIHDRAFGGFQVLKQLRRPRTMNGSVIYLMMTLAPHGIISPIMTVNVVWEWGEIVRG